MDISYYYHTLEIGIIYEKGQNAGGRWRIGERRRLREETAFWLKLLKYIADEQRGFNCSADFFSNLECLCNRFNLPNYARIISKKDQLLNGDCRFERKSDEEMRIRGLIEHLLLDLQTSINKPNAKDLAYRILAVLHNLPKAMHGRNVLDDTCILMEFSDALSYAQSYMNTTMYEKYKHYFSQI